jgi:hypothetical protein
LRKRRYTRPPARQPGVAIRKYATELIGTFFLTFAVGVAALSGSGFVPLAALARALVNPASVKTLTLSGHAQGT